MKLLLACVMCAASISPALAAGPYIGLGVNVTNQEGGNNTFASVKLRGGYDFNETWGVEAGILGVPQYDAYDWRSNPGKARGHSMYVAGKATMPISEKFSLVTKLGVAHTRLKFEDSTPIGSTAFDKTYTTGVYAAIGLKYALTEKTSISLELERMGRQSSRIRRGAQGDAVSLNVNYSF